MAFGSIDYDAIARLRSNLTASDIHLIGKLLLGVNDATMEDLEFSEDDRAAADVLAEEFADGLNAAFGGDEWQTAEVL